MFIEVVRARVPNGAWAFLCLWGLGDWTRGQALRKLAEAGKQQGRWPKRLILFVRMILVPGEKPEQEAGGGPTQMGK